MTCTSKEKEMYDQFQRERDGKIKATYKQKIESQTDNRRKSDSSSAFSQQSEEASTSSTRVFSASIRLWF
jgi:hypothetical protein